MRYKVNKILVVLVAAVCAQFFVEVAMAIEEPVYKVIRKEGEISLREYPSSIVAETSVEGSFDEVSNEGFRRLAGFIFGGNEISQKIAMTAPVGMEKPGGDSWVIRFTMPAEYTLKTLPKPKDARVELKEIPARTVAAFEYSGTWSKERFDERKQKLLAWIEKNEFVRKSEATLARYNPPWTPWFLRRNEVLIQVEKVKKN